MGRQTLGSAKYHLALLANAQHQALATRLQSILQSNPLIDNVQEGTLATLTSDCNDVIVVIASEGVSTWVATYQEEAPCAILLAVTPQSDTIPPDIPAYRTDTPPDILAQQIITGIQLAEQKKRNQALHRLAQIINQVIEPDEALSELFVLLHTLVPYTGINLTGLSEQFLYVQAHRGYTAEDAKKFMHPRTVMDANWLTDIIAGGEVAYMPDIPKTLTPLFPWLRAWAGIPIKKQGEVISILNVDADQTRKIHPVHIDRLMQLAPQIAVLIETLQLYDTLKQTNSLLRAISRQNSFLFTPLSSYKGVPDLCQAIVESVLTSFNATDCGVLLIQDQENQLTRCARAGDYEVNAQEPLYIDGPGLVAEAIRTESVVYAPNVNEHPKYLASEPRTKAELVIPMPSQNGVIGVLDLQSTDYDAFSPRDVENLTAFGEHAGAAIVNLMTYHKQRDYSRGLEERVRDRTAALNASKKRVEAILNRTSDALVLLDPDGKIEQVNRAFNDLFQVQPDAFFQCPLQDLTVADHYTRLDTMIERVQAEGKPQTLELQMMDQSDRTFDAELTLSVVRFERREERSRRDMVASIRDISKHKSIQTHLQQLLEAERELSNLKSRFILTVSHEFRTPLTVILSSSDLLDSRGSKMSPERRKKHLTRIKDQVNHMETMLSDALMVGQAEQDKLDYHPERLNLTEIGRSVTESLNRAGTRPQIRFSHPDEDIILNADKTLMQQIINNLLMNAVKYAPNTNAVYFSLRTDADTVTIEVKDHGIGIPPTEQNALFQPFYRAKNVNTTPGSGLGLSIVRYAVQQHDGTVWVDSTLGEGSTFYVSLPR